MSFKYLTEDAIININKVAIILFEIKKADKHELLSYSKLCNALNVCKTYSGDCYDKAVILLQQLTKSHPFASGNRRTAMLATIIFLRLNDRKVYIKDTPYNSRTMIGVRENYYSFNEIKNWLKNGKIKEFKRK